MTRSSLETAPMLRNACVYTPGICRSEFALCIGASSGKRLVCHVRLGTAATQTCSFSVFVDFYGTTLGPFVAVWATPWTPHAFMQAARLLPHPFQDVALDYNNFQLCFCNFTKGPAVVTAQQSRFVNRWTATAQPLKSADVWFRKSLHPVVDKVVRNFPRCFRSLGSRCMNILCSSLIGQLETRIFEVLAMHSVSCRFSCRGSLAPRCTAGIHSIGYPKIAVDVDQTTHDETDKGVRSQLDSSHVFVECALGFFLRRERS